MSSRTCIVLLAFVLSSRTAAAQTVTLAPVDPKRWDASLAFGWLGGDKSDVADDWNDWYSTFATSLEVGRYWTPNVKTEVAAALTTDGRVHSTELVTVPGLPSPVFVAHEHRYRVRAVNASAAYQFLQNAWVHPYAAAGVQLGWERHRVQQPFGFPPRGPVVPVDETHTTFDPRPFLSGGAKFYVSEQAFIRSDLSAAFDGRGPARVWWRVGAGLDF